MTIIVYGKPGCGKCEAAKDKLRKMGFAFTARNLADFVELHDGWREDGSTAVMAAHSHMDTMPLIQIGDAFFDYPSAMKALKRMKKGEKDV